MRVSVDVNDIHIRSFKGRIKMVDCVFISFAREIYENKEIKSEDTLYFKWLKRAFEKRGKLWEYIETEEDMVRRVDVFRKLIDSLKENGYKRRLEPKKIVIKGVEYGALTAKKVKDGYDLIDGHHRISILIMLGSKTVTLKVND